MFRPCLFAPFAAALLAAALPAPAADWKALKPTGHVSDFAQVLDPAEARRLESYCSWLEQKSGVQLALVTIASLEGEPVEDVANVLFRSWGVGAKKSNEGLLLLLSIRDRRSRLEVGYGLEPVLPDGSAGSILRQMRPALRKEAYGDALAAAAEAIAGRVAEAKKISLEGQPAHPGRRRHAEPFPWPVAVAGFIGLLMVLSALSRMNGRGGGGGILPALVLGNLLGSGGSHSRSGGGFGGGDSGGGFGGGDSGGGGASSDW